MLPNPPFNFMLKWPDSAKFFTVWRSDGKFSTPVSISLNIWNPVSRFFQNPSDIHTVWTGVQKHPPTDIKKVNIVQGNRTISNTMLHNMRNREEACELYQHEIPKLTKKIKRANENTAEELLKVVAITITNPWTEMAKRRP